MSDASWLLDVLDEPTSSVTIQRLLSTISEEPVELTGKEFKTVLYRSSQKHGLSLQYEKEDNEWTCKAIDLYNSDAVKGWSCFSRLPIELDLTDNNGKLSSFPLHKDTTGVDIVRQLGEPQRKGGGEPMKGGGASGLGPAAWMEWTFHCNNKLVQIMIEMAGQEARGTDRWEKERSGSARWSVFTISLL